jgi:hypothetical protein
MLLLVFLIVILTGFLLISKIKWMYLFSIFCLIFLIPDSCLSILITFLTHDTLLLEHLVSFLWFTHLPWNFVEFL